VLRRCGIGDHGAEHTRTRRPKEIAPERVTPCPSATLTSRNSNPETAMITNTQSGTRIDEIADGIYRISTPADLPGGAAFSFNQYLVVDDAPLLFHTGMRSIFPVVSEAICAVMPLERLRYVAS